MNTSTLKQKLLLTYAHLGPEEAERLAQRDVEAVQAEAMPSMRFVKEYKEGHEDATFTNYVWDRLGGK